MRKYQVISADGHIESHAQLWSTRVAEKYRDRAPRYGKLEDGTEAWILDEGVMPISVETTTGGRPYDQMVKKNISYYKEDGSYRAGLGDGTQRVREQDIDGIDAEVLYPPVAGPNFVRKILEGGDKEAYKAVVRGYNTWLGEDFCSVAPDRLIGLGILPETGVDDAIAEMELCHKMGLRGICLNMWPNGSLDPSDEDDRFWAAALDMGMKMAPHQNFGRTGASAAAGAVAQTSSRTNPGAGALGGGDDVSWVGARSRIISRPSHTVGQMIGRGTFDRFPDLKVYFAESDAGWLPYLLDLTDDWYMRYYHERGVRLNKLPSEYWRDHIRLCFLWDPTAIRARYEIGVDLLLWGSDLPHSTGSFPHSREVIDVQFAGVPEDEKYAMTVGNACEFFDLDPNKELTPTP